MPWQPHTPWFYQMAEDPPARRGAWCHVFLHGGDVMYTARWLKPRSHGRFIIANRVVETAAVRSWRYLVSVPAVGRHEEEQADAAHEEECEDDAHVW